MTKEHLTEMSMEEESWLGLPATLPAPDATYPPASSSGERTSSSSVTSDDKPSPFMQRLFQRRRAKKEASSKSWVAGDDEVESQYTQTASKSCRMQLKQAIHGGYLT
jgi:hypothetical protein